MNQHSTPLQTRMIDVGGKPDTERTAEAEGWVSMAPETACRIVAGEVPKGDVLNTARVAGIMAAKRTAELLPLCHPLLINSVSVELEVDAATGRVRVAATVRCTGKTGVEMEALTAVSTAALTVYDMCKALDPAMVIGGICLRTKTGGKTGDYRRSS